MLFRESRVRRNLIAALMCGWKRNARIENVKRVIKLPLSASVSLLRRKSIWPVVSPWSASRKLPLVFTMTA